VPESTRIAHPDVDWRALARVRDRVVHHYWDVDPGALRHIVRVDVPSVLPALRVARDAAAEALKARREGDGRPELW
jgi:uncharacterized protein with HEPN domain